MSNKIYITLKGEPKSTGNIYRSVCRGSFPTVYMTPAGKTLKESYSWQAKSQYRYKPTTDPVILEALLFFGTKRRQDIDNYNKILLDSLTGILWEDDSQIVELHLVKGYDKTDPRVQICLTLAK